MKAKRAQPLRFFENLPANLVLPLVYPLRSVYIWTAYQDGETLQCREYTILVLTCSIHLAIAILRKLLSIKISW